MKPIFDHAAYQRTRYERLRESGLCVLCRQPTESGLAACAACRKKQCDLRHVKRRPFVSPPPDEANSSPSPRPQPDMNKVTLFLTGKPVLRPMPEGIEWNQAVTIIRMFTGGRSTLAQTRDRHEAERLWRRAKAECLELDGPIRVSIAQGVKIFLTVKRHLPGLRLLPPAPASSNHRPSTINPQLRRTA